MKAKAQIFLSYAREDKEEVEGLYQKLSAAGFNPWMDKKDIVPGEKWASAIRRAVRDSDFFLVCLSTNSVKKRGWVQREMKQALDLWQEKLEDDIYLIPVRLEDCEAPESLREFQWVNLFEEDGWTRLVKAIQEGLDRRVEVTNLLFRNPHQEEGTERSQKHNNLPSYLTPLIGRSKEVSAVEKLLLQKEVRLLALTGPGGIGKTRLSLQVAHNLLDKFKDGVFFVSLAGLTEHSPVFSVIVQALGIGQISSQTSRERLAGYLREKQLLLVLDSFEHLLEAAPQLVELLTECPELRIIVTSRASLHVRGEYEFLLPPLALPDLKNLPSLEILSQCAAVELFTRHALAVKSDFTLTKENAATVAEITVRLDGLPLAIELAAARIKVIPLQTMLAKLESRLSLLTGGTQDMPARQQTMRAAIDWSYRLLDAREQRLFRRLSVFVGGCTLEAAAAVCNPVDLFEGIASLIDKSLLLQEKRVNGEPRFRMLETIREYGQELLEISKDVATINQQYANYFLSIAEDIEPLYINKEYPAWLDQMEREYDNLRAALEWFISQREADKSLRLVGALWPFWEIRGYLTEGQVWLEKVLAESTDASKTYLARTLRIAAQIAKGQGDYERAEGMFEDSLALFREQKDKAGIALTLAFFGNLPRFRGDYKLAATMYEEAMCLFKEVGDSRGLALALNGLGATAQYEGDLDRAEKYLRDSLALSQDLGDLWCSAVALSRLGHVAKYRGAYIRASALWQESMAIAKGLGDKLEMAISLADIGEMAYHQEDCSQARSLCVEGLDLFRDLGDKRGTGRVLTLLGNIALAEGECERAVGLYRESLATMVAIGDRKGIAKNLLGLGRVIGIQGDTEGAIQLLASASNMLDAIGAALAPFDRAELERNVALAKVELGEESFAAAWSQGREMTLEQAVESALTFVLVDPPQTQS